MAKIEIKIPLPVRTGWNQDFVDDRNSKNQDFNTTMTTPAIPTFTTLKEVKDYFAGQPKGTQCYLNSSSTGAQLQTNLREQYGTYVTFKTESSGLYLLTFDRYDQSKVDAWRKAHATAKTVANASKNTGSQPTWKDIKDTTKIGDTAYVVMNKSTLLMQISKHWGSGSGAGVASVIKNGDGWDVTRLK